MNAFKKYLILMLIIGLAGIQGLLAQDGLEIKKAFDLYGNKKGSVMVELSGELLDDYDLALFKSLIVKNNPEAADFIRKSLKKDEVGAKKVKQVIANGVPTSIYMQLPQKGKYYRLVLFNDASDPEPQVTLIYIESKDNSEDVLKLILKKK